MEITEILTEIDRLKAEIDALRPIDPAQERRIMQKFRLDWTYHSNAIEGNTLLTAMNLFMNGARGESIEPSNDLDEKIAPLRKQDNGRFS